MFSSKLYLVKVPPLEDGIVKLRQELSKKEVRNKTKPDDHVTRSTPAYFTNRIGQGQRVRRIHQTNKKMSGLG